MQTIFQANKQYLMQKIKISQAPGPSKYYRKIPSRTPNTTYNKQFHKNVANLSNQLKLQRKDNLFISKKNVTAYDTFYNQNFNQKINNFILANGTNKIEYHIKGNSNNNIEDHIKGNSNNNKHSSQKNMFSIASSSHINSQRHDLLKRQQQKQSNIFLHNQAPSFHNTSYGLDYKNKHHNTIKTQSIKNISNKLMGGGIFKAQSTYNNVYKINQNHKNKKQMPIYQSNNKIFMTINSPFESTYQKQYNNNNINNKNNSKNNKNKIQNNKNKIQNNKNKIQNIKDKRSKTINYDQKSMTSRTYKLADNNLNHNLRKQSTNQNNNDKIRQIQRIKYKSEYQRSFRTDQKNKFKNNSQSLMTIQAMKKLILNVI